MLISKTELLEKLPIFRGLSEKQLSSIVDIASKAFFEAGDKLIAKDETGHASFVIVTGSAICVNFPAAGGGGAVIETGSLVGELAMLVETVHLFTVEAREKVRAMVIHRDGLTRAMERDPAIAQQISDNLLVRLQSLARDLRQFDGIFAQVEMVSEVRVAYGEKQQYSPVAIGQPPHQSGSGSMLPATAVKRFSRFGDSQSVTDAKRDGATWESSHYIRRAKTIFRDMTQKSMA